MGESVIKTIISNVAFAILTVFILDRILDSYLFGIIGIVSLWVVFDYIKKLETKTDVDIKTKKIGTISYLLTNWFSWITIICSLIRLNNTKYTLI